MQDRCDFAGGVGVCAAACRVGHRDEIGVQINQFACRVARHVVGQNPTRRKDLERDGRALVVGLRAFERVDDFLHGPDYKRLYAIGKPLSGDSLYRCSCMRHRKFIWLLSCGAERLYLARPISGWREGIRATPKPALFCTAGWEFLWARRHLQLIVNALNLFSLMLNGLAE